MAHQPTDELDVQILRMVAEAQSWRAIAVATALSERTVRRRLSAYRESVGARTLLEAVARAARAGVI